MIAFRDWNNTFIVQTDISAVGAWAGPLLPEGHEEQVPTFTSHRVSKTDSRQGPTERECMTALWAIKYFRQYAAGSTHMAVS